MLFIKTILKCKTMKFGLIRQRENDTLVNAILVLIILHYIPEVWWVSIWAYQTPEHTTTKNKGDQDCSDVPSGQASWGAVDIHTFNVACCGLMRVGSAHPCPQPASHSRDTLRLWLRWNKAYWVKTNKQTKNGSQTLQGWLFFRLFSRLY